MLYVLLVILLNLCYALFNLFPLPDINQPEITETCNISMK